MRMGWCGRTDLRGFLIAVGDLRRLVSVVGGVSGRALLRGACCGRGLAGVT